MTTDLNIAPDKLERDIQQNEVMHGEPDRKRYLGGSDAAALIGLGAYGKTPYTVWLSKTGQITEQADPDKEKFFRRRKRFEPLIVEMLREEFDAEIVSVNQRYIDREHSFIAAEIDFEWRDPETGLIEGGEIKTVSPFAFGERHGWGEPGSDEIPIHYAAQVVHGQGIRGYRKTIVAALVGFDTMLFYQVQRDDALIATMRAACVKFWNENVLGGKVPEPINLEDAKIQTLRTPQGRPVVLTDEMYEMLDKIKLARGTLKLATEQDEEYTFQLLRYLCQQWDVEPSIEEGMKIAQVIELMNEELPADNALLIYGDRAVAKYNRQRGTHLDQKRLKKDKPDISAAYTKEHFFRVLREVKPPKPKKQ